MATEACWPLTFSTPWPHYFPPKAINLVLGCRSHLRPGLIYDQWSVIILQILVKTCEIVILLFYQVSLWIGRTATDRAKCIHRQIIHNSSRCFQLIIFAIIAIIVTIRCPSLSFPSSLYSTGPQPHIFPGLSLVPYRYDPAKLPECALANRQFWIICALLTLGNVQSYWSCNVSDNCTTSPFAFKMPPTLPIPSGSTSS